MNANGLLWRPKTSGVRAPGSEVPSLASALSGSVRLDRFSRLGLVDHLFILRALILRNIRFKYRDNAFGVVMQYFRISSVIVAHYFLFWLRNKPLPGHIPLECFVIAAFANWYAFKDTFRATEGGWKFGATVVPGISQMHMRLAKATWAFISTLFFSLIAAVVLNAFGDNVNYPDLGLTTLIIAISSALGFGFGLVVEALENVWPMVEPVSHLMLWVLFVSSGIYWSLPQTPPITAAVFLWNPILNLTEYNRHSFETGYPVGLVSLTYPAVCAVGLWLIGLSLDRWLRARDRE
jgi:ABC-type polysaccharide/polyol phosphate export permease